MNEQEFLAAYDPRAYPAVAVTVDVVALTVRSDALHLLLVRRGGPPFEGHWALPGGFVRPEEDLATGARRELAEETGLGGERLRRVHLEQLASYGDPDRDPRMRIVSVAYLAFAPDLPDPAAGSDADDAIWLPVTALSSRQLAFDHDRIIDDGLERARSKLEYTPLATRFLDTEFTISELRAVYETVWGHPLHPGNFHRKVLSVPGFVESTGASTERGGTRGGPRAKLYRAGDARLLHPALLRPAREETVR
ncbi:NUDIX domain-containing protein [Micromonospora harpali]|uniref:8-oxo-dGTP diphosphatase n=2 Tax=Micromonospora TaxID=1873 RepID=A0A1C4WXE6_9ACTN|nr:MULTISPECIES: NUDIX domain-containing protein [Micromonospora]MDI5937518.1 NUDIX domain-containing protein [Micromonospora sp. DH15]OON33005.1 DNA hydrolase [Micromonospora sp. Rc5]SCF00902.1 8-oxo-dGTP diphosphatase [Micromonospora haikouensis]